MKKVLTFAHQVVNLFKKQEDLYSPYQRISRHFMLKKINKIPLSETDPIISNEIKSQAQRIKNVESKEKAETKWISFKTAIKKHIINDNINGFIFWPEILYNMHYTPSIKEIKYLKNRPTWPSYKKAIQIVSNKIKQIPFFAYPNANENSIRQAYSFENFLQQTKIPLTKIEQIFEFGGGYGSMCTIINRLGFKGDYIIFDWPELSIIQKYYLSQEKVPLNNINFVNDLDQAKGILKNKPTLLIATWSLSECSFDLREKILNLVKPDYILIGYQKDFAGLDNQKYFATFQEKMNDYDWISMDFDYIPSQKNKYLFGKKHA